MAKQSNDPVIDEVRSVRNGISERCGNDPERLVAYYMQLQQQFQDRLIASTRPLTARTVIAALGQGGRGWQNPLKLR
jgi:hypothetical protein